MMVSIAYLAVCRAPNNHNAGNSRLRWWPRWDAGSPARTEPATPTWRLRNLKGAGRDSRGRDDRRRRVLGARHQPRPWFKRPVIVGKTGTNSELSLPVPYPSGRSGKEMGRAPRAEKTGEFDHDLRRDGSRAESGNRDATGWDRSRLEERRCAKDQVGHLFDGDRRDSHGHQRLTRIGMWRRRAVALARLRIQGGVAVSSTIQIARSPTPGEDGRQNTRGFRCGFWVLLASSTEASSQIFRPQKIQRPWRRVKGLMGQSCGGAGTGKHGLRGGSDARPGFHAGGRLVARAP